MIEKRLTATLLTCICAGAAIFGGYALTSLFTVTLSLTLPWLGVNQADAVLASSMVSFLIYAAIIMAIFHARSRLRAGIGLGFASITCVLIIAGSKLTGGF